MKAMIMKIAICSEQNRPDSVISQRFGRSPWIAVYDKNTSQWDFAANNQNLDAVQGAGIQTAQNILNTGASIVLACNLGPKAMSVLQAANAKVYQAQENSGIDTNVEMFLQGALELMKQANVEGHWI